VFHLGVIAIALSMIFKAVYLSFHQFLNRDSLEYQMCPATLINNADVHVIDSAQAWVALATALVEQQTMLGRPCLSLVKTHLDAVMRSTLLRMRVGEQQYRLRLVALTVIEAVQAAVAVGLDDAHAVGCMRRPRSAEILCYGDGAKLRRVLCAAVQH